MMMPEVTAIHLELGGPEVHLTCNHKFSGRKAKRVYERYCKRGHTVHGMRAKCVYEDCFTNRKSSPNVGETPR